MYEKFNDPEKAVSYLTTGLLHDFPDAEAEIIWFQNHRARQRACAVTNITPVLSQLCAQFPRASVEYRPEHPYGYVAEIQCHGETNPSRDTKFIRRNTSDRPRVVILLKRIHNQDVLLGVSAAPRENPGLVPGSPTR